MAIQYLKIIGRVTDKKLLKIRHSYIVERPKIRKQTADSPLHAVCLDKAEKILNDTPILARPYNLPKEVSHALAVRGFVPIPPRTAVVRFLWEGKTILELPVREKPPEVRVDWKNILANPKTGGKREIRWTPLSGNPETLRSYCEYSIDNGKTWRRLPLPVGAKTHTIDFDRLPGGPKCRLALVVTDGVLVSRMESPAFAIGVKPCVVKIFHPMNGAKFDQGKKVELIGQGFYLEEEKPEQKDLRWESSRDGLLGSGSPIQVTQLRKGTHTITLTAGKGRRAGRNQISIQIL